MKVAREIATISYRSGPEWRQRFGRQKIEGAAISLCPTFLIEQYIDHQGERASVMLDPNTLLYISKAMDLFELGAEDLKKIQMPTLIMGVTTDALFPVWQQREMAHQLMENGTPTTYYELPSLYGHDTFLLDIHGVGTAIKVHGKQKFSKFSQSLLQTQTSDIQRIKFSDLVGLFGNFRQRTDRSHRITEYNFAISVLLILYFFFTNAVRRVRELHCSMVCTLQIQVRVEKV